MKKFIIILITVLLCSFIYVLIPSDKSENKEPSLQKVRIAQAGKEKFLLYLPLYVAMEEDLFTKQGLDVELSFAGNDDQVVATVIGNAADFGVGDPIFSAIAQEKGGKIKTVALMITKLTLTGYTKNTDLPIINKPQDLDGLKVSSWPAPSTMYTQLEQIKKDYNLNLGLIPGAFNAQLAMLEADKVDIAIDLEPAATLAEEKGYKVVLEFTRFMDPQAITGLTVKEEFIRQHPEVVQKVVNALQQAMTAIYKDKNIAYTVARKLFPDLSDKVIQNAVDRIVDNDSYPRSVEVSDKYWQRSIQSRLASGELANPQATDVATDNTFAKKAFEKYGR